MGEGIPEDCESQAKEAKETGDSVTWSLAQGCMRVSVRDLGENCLSFLGDGGGSLPCCPTVACTAAKETSRNWTRSPRERKKNRKMFSRHPALNPCPSYTLSACPHIPKL